MMDKSIYEYIMEGVDQRELSLAYFFIRRGYGHFSGILTKLVSVWDIEH